MGKKVFLFHDEFKHETWSMNEEQYDIIKCQSHVKRLLKNKISIEPPRGTFSIIADDMKDVRDAMDDESARSRLVADKKAKLLKCNSFCKFTKNCPRYMSALNIIEAFEI